MSELARRAVQVDVAVERWPLDWPVHITGHTIAEATVLVVTLSSAGSVGRGEAAGVYYLNDDVAKMTAQIEAIRPRARSGLNRVELLELLPPGGARNAMDCALWDLESQLSGEPVWRLAGLAAPRPLVTTFTCGAADPEAMAADARSHRQASAIKLKLTGEAVDAQRVQAVRDARPDVWLAVDANQGFDRRSLESLLPVLVNAQVRLIEQPFPRGCDIWLDELRSPIAIAADESIQTAAELRAFGRHFDVVNIKLDKCGGLTEALTMARAARELGVEAMVGCMAGTSLAIAPAFLLGQLSRIVDLDAPFFLSKDRAPAVEYRGATVCCPDALWGTPR